MTILAQSNFDAAMSGLIFVGEDTSEFPLDGIEVFKDPKNHATAAASVLVHSAKTVEFHPSEQPAKSLAPALDRFVQKASVFPGFLFRHTTDSSLHLRNGSSAKDIESQIHAAYNNTPHIDYLAREFRDLVPFKNEDESLQKWVLSVILLDKPVGSDVIHLKFARITLNITYLHDITSARAHIPEQEARIIFADYDVNASFLLDKANALAGMIPIVQVEIAIPYFASPTIACNGPLEDTIVHNAASCGRHSITMSDELENLKRWNADLIEMPHNVPMPVLTNNKTEVVAQPFYFSVEPKGAKGIELWRNPDNHADAAATVLTYSGTKSGFIPSLGLKDQADKFNAYIKRVSTFPGFFIVKSEETGEHVASQDINLMINQIRNAYVGFAEADVDALINSVQDMANSILNNSSKESDKSIFSQDTISKSNNMNYVTIFYATLDMKEDKQGKKTYVDQKYRIFRTLIRINTTYMTTFAEELNQMMGDGGLGEWDEQGSSPTGPNKSCFEKHFENAPKEP
ncbi:hypothetical protein BGX28_001559 [Mortierella sp. GBA30]|nr:hypothetical protein BGX28_001559 [Mortierella sp. GBA30]